MKTKQIFNPLGQDPSPQVFGGNSTGICKLNNIARPWANNLYQLMRSNFWIPEKFDLTTDKNDYWNLTEFERNAYDKILSFLVVLDSFQENYIPYVKQLVSSPEINNCLTEQCSQEALHSQSYQVIVQSILEKDARDIVYERWRVDPVLKERCEVIGSFYQSYIDEPTIDNYLKALMADYILEGLYFPCGFAFFYTLSARGLMPGTSDIIKMIHRDELTHVTLYQKLLIEARNEFPDADWQGFEEMYLDAIPHEIKWNNYVFGDNILGMSAQATTEYVNYTVATRLKAIGFDYDLSQYKNPFQHLERFGNVGGEENTKANFFERIPIYGIENNRDGWDEF